MKLFTLTIILILGFKTTAQSSFILDNIFDLNLKFKMHQDSLNKLYLVKCYDKSPFDSAKVNVDGHVLNIDNLLPNTSLLACKYSENKIQTYLYSKSVTDSFLVFLSFYSKRLIQIDIHYKSAEKSSYIKNKLTNHFGKYEAKMSDKKISVVSLTGQEPFRSLYISDKVAFSLMPSWCGNDQGHGSWAKLDKYLDKK